MMVNKGQLVGESASGNPILKTNDGDQYEISFFALFIWKRLDGTTPLEKIKESVAKAGNIEEDKLDGKVEWVTNELKQVGLASQKESSASV